MFGKKANKIIALFIIGIMTIGFAGCSNQTGTKEGKTEIEKIKESGKIVLGTSADYPPFEFHKEVNGKDTIVGFDIEIAKEIAKDLNVELEIKEMSFDPLIMALQNNKIDMVLAGMTPDKERAKKVDFSDKYFFGKHYIVINGKNKDSIKTLEDLKGKTIGVQKGAVQQKIAQKEISGAKLKPLVKVPDLILQLRSNKVDAVLIEDIVAKSYVENNKDLVLPGIEFKDKEGGYSVALRKNNKELVESINKTIKRLQKEGLIDKYFEEANKMSK
ncbi:amino acid ABC transporter substrate-binding protein, PAAT family [Gottschalkia purinilytica]|uniref:Amino acid ABC transporter substrate-binding protein, PAAT family n=1 Tax=Gottschalkia purinilytica TaxID=1503 RepID=A0A0L0WER8_GOTPU|nr:transporter substrate-binding domain-containing protein [Gottschalkia purinilytica]KNF09963.1 amino acid ABC transporter substrate-binding protein, PAAT family [Gottschalkia purinilytica]